MFHAYCRLSDTVWLIGFVSIGASLICTHTLSVICNTSTHKLSEEEWQTNSVRVGGVNLISIAAIYFDVFCLGMSLAPVVSQ